MGVSSDVEAAQRKTEAGTRYRASACRLEHMLSPGDTAGGVNRRQSHQE